jgi:uncharacterized membrane protein YdfJ with MMPL/SSD domain
MPGSPALARLLHRLGKFSAQHKWVVLGAWLVALVVVIGLVKSVGANTSNNLELPGTDSQAATDLLAKRFPPQQNGKNPIVFHAPDGKVTDAQNKEAIQQSFDAIKRLPHVYSATSPFSQQGQAQISKDEQTAFLTVLLEIGNEKVTEGLAQRFLDAAEPARKAGMKVAASGQIGSELSEPETHSSDVIGIFAAMVILTLTFGTLVAMGMAIVPAVLGLLVGLSIIGLLGHVTEVPSIAPTLATMIGLGVGIDYALFMVSRYRAHRAEGMDTPDAIAEAVGTTGTAIVFAGGTVVIALVSLLVAGIPLVTSLGYASAFAVVTAVLAAITLLPALLALIGNRIDSLALPAFLHPKEKPPDRGFWAGWARSVTGHPGRSIAITLALLGVLIIPFFSLELGQEDIGATPKDTTERQAYDLIAEGFGPGYTGPLLVAVNLEDEPAEPSAQFEKQYATAQELQAELEQEQATGQAGAESLERSAEELEAQQAQLLAEKAALETKAGDLKREKAQLEKSSAQLKKQRTIVDQLDDLVAEAAALVRSGAELAADSARAVAKLEEVKAAEELTEAQLQQPHTPEERARLEARLRLLQRREAKLEQELAGIRAAQQSLKSQGAAVHREASRLKKQAESLGAETLELASDAADAAAEAVTLLNRKNKLVQQAAGAKVKAANLNTQKAQLEALQEEAAAQQQQAEKLKATLTDELTLAGGDERGTDTRLVGLQEALTATIGVLLVSPPDINKKGDAAVYTVIPDGDPADEETADLVTTIRDYVVPQSTHGEDIEAHVGGSTAGNVDLASAIASKLFLVLFAVNALGFLVLLMAFRSFLVSTQAVFAIMLSVCAAFGVLTACFQFGWGIDLIGIDTDSDSVPIASYVPLIMFAVLFGLSMDYQVFLMSQIEHARTKTADEVSAVRAGLAAGGRVISAAALIMISVFGSFILNGDPTVKQFGVGLATGVALAALCVLLLAPAILTLAGKAAWWIPRWADRLLPKIDIEGAGASEAADRNAADRGARGDRGDSMLL